MMLLKAKFLIPCAILALLITDYFYFDQLKKQYDGGAVNESFLRKGRLGEILNQHNLLKISPDTAHLVKQGMCAKKDYFKGFDYHNNFRMRLKLNSTQHEYVHIKLHILKAKRHSRVETVLTIRPGKEYYDLTFIADQNRDIEVTFSTGQKSSLSIQEIIIDGQFGRSRTLVSQGKPIMGEFSYGESVSQADNISIEKKIYYSAKQALSPKLFSGTFPGKKKQGFCQYTANNGPLKTPTLPSTHKTIHSIIPRVNITVDDKDLHGKKGLFNNKEMKGRVWEVPALISINNGQRQEHQQIGLRFHGGSPGRKKDILSFRVNARKQYGVSEITTETLFGTPRKRGAKGIVFKYTYQAYNEDKINYNPFNHALALDIANVIGAIVPPHKLVDFTINNQPQGLFLAMEHLSKRTIKNWLGRDNFTLYTYKKFNTKSNSERLLMLLGEIMRARGEDAFATLNKYYDIDNVINSILLSAFIADDDYCQGIEIIDHAVDEKQAKITSINWDLDHAFLSYQNGQFSMPAKHAFSPAFSILMKGKNMQESLCPRKWVYAHVYQQSPTFKKRIKTKLEALLNNQLNPSNTEKMLDQYKAINQHYYNNEYTDIIEAISSFLKERPKILLEELAELEQSVSANTPIH